MNLRKLPPSVAMALGLTACTVGACLDVGPAEESGDPPMGSDSGTTAGSSGSGSDSGTAGTASGTSTTGAMSTDAGDATTGPCLGNIPETTGTDGSGDGGTSTDTGMALDAAPTRAAALRRVLERGALPADVAARLAAKAKER